ncbi:MAG: dihydrodipicolinate synthase family protein [Clostridia bacterium]|nr:dihydrodipicolinate synthase family protein [Clostridia bacterium]
MEKLFTGIHSAIFSIYDENMNVKKDSVAKLVEYQLDAGLQGFYVGGNTGECTVLPAKTRKQMLETVVDVNDGRGKIMAHIGAGHFDEVMDLLDHANHQKIDAIASLPPSLCSYYGHKETIEYYKTLAKNSKYPVYAYVTPITMQHSELYSFAKELSAIENVAGLKITIPD